jgi:Spy/CpxP family protein refolding chaperone
MAMGKWFLCAALVLAGGSMLVAADDTMAPATQPADAKPAKPKKLTLPWSMMKTLTPEQTAQIEKIHSDAAEQIKAIDAKELADITALLTPAQLAELQTVEARRKADASQRRKEAATQP